MTKRTAHENVTFHSNCGQLRVLRHIYFHADQALILHGVVAAHLANSASGFLMSTGDLAVGAGLAAGTTGTLIGDNVHYTLGRWGLRRFKRVRNLLDRSDEVYAFLHKRSKWAYLFFHFPVYLRTILPMELGAARFSLKTWWWIDAIAALLFNAAYITLGYVLGGMSGDLVGAGKAGNTIALLFFAVFGYWT